MICNSALTLSVHRFMLRLPQASPLTCRFAYIGHWVFTVELLPALFAATAASRTYEKARVVTVSSSANYLTKELDFEALADGPGRKKHNTWELYYKSKFVRIRYRFYPPLTGPLG